MIKIKKENTASFDVDCQKGFTPLCPNELPVPDADNPKMIEELNKQAQKSKFRIGSKDAHPAKAEWTAETKEQVMQPIETDNTEVDVYWSKHCAVGTYGYESLDGLPHVSDYDFFVYKGIEPDMHPYGIFFHQPSRRQSTGLFEYLVLQDIDTFIFGGLAIEYCLKISIIELLDLTSDETWKDKTVILNLGAARGLAEESILKAIEELKSRGVIVINSADELELIE